MTARRSFALLCAAALCAAMPIAAQTAASGGFPNKVVRIINPFPPGSGPDAVARIVGEKLGKAWGQPVIVENRPGASGFLALKAAKHAPATGYDIVLAAADHMAINPSLFKKLPYSATNDFVPIGGLYRTSFFVLVSEESPYKTLPQLVAYMRSGPNKATYGSNAIGSPLHLGGAQIEAATSSVMQHVPFKETTGLYQAVAMGDVTWALGSIGSAGPLIKSGKLRVLAVADTKRSPAMPEVPTIAEAGGPAVATPTWVALFAPAGTPAPVVASIEKAVQAALAMPDVREKFMLMGFQPAPAPGAEVAKWIRADQGHYADLIKQTGATAD